MNAHAHIIILLIAIIVPLGGATALAGRKIAKMSRRLRFRPPASMWKRTASPEPHLRPPVNGGIIRPVAIHISRRHHAPLPKEPGKLWR